MIFSHLRKARESVRNLHYSKTFYTQQLSCTFENSHCSADLLHAISGCCEQVHLRKHLAAARCMIALSQLQLAHPDPCLSACTVLDTPYECLVRNAVLHLSVMHVLHKYTVASSAVSVHIGNGISPGRGTAARLPRSPRGTSPASPASVAAAPSVPAASIASATPVSLMIACATIALLMTVLRVSVSGATLQQQSMSVVCSSRSSICWSNRVITEPAMAPTGTQTQSHSQRTARCPKLVCHICGNASRKRKRQHLLGIAGAIAIGLGASTAGRAAWLPLLPGRALRGSPGC